MMKFEVCALEDNSPDLLRNSLFHERDSRLTVSVSANNSRELSQYFSYLFEKRSELDKRKEKTQIKKMSKKTSKSENSKFFENDSNTETYFHFTNLPNVQIHKNPSYFAVFAAIRATCLESQFQRYKSLQPLISPNKEKIQIFPKGSSIFEPIFPKILGIGLKMTFEILRSSRETHSDICLLALESLHSMLLGIKVGELFQEPIELMESLWSILYDLSFSSSSSSSIRILSMETLLVFALSSGQISKILILSTSLLSKYKDVPLSLPAPLLSFQLLLLSSLCKTTSEQLPDFLNVGFEAKALVDSFNISFDSGLTPRKFYSFASESSFIILSSEFGLFKVRTSHEGFKGIIMAFQESKEPYSWMGWLNRRLYGEKRKNSSLFLELDEICPLTLKVIKEIVVDSTCSLLSSSSSLSHLTCSDGVSLCLLIFSSTQTQLNSFTLHFISESNWNVIETQPIQLSIISFLVFGFSSPGIKSTNNLDLNSEKYKVVEIVAGKDFALLLTQEGDVYISGKSSSIGLEVGNISGNGLWTPLCLPDKAFIVQIALGHEGLHALLLSKEGVVYFTGLARRGEDGDISKIRCPGKPSQPKRMSRLDGVFVTGVACNNGTSAIITKEGHLYLFGKDSNHSDYSTGQVLELKDIVQVTLGKAHVVALTSSGSLITFGMNSKGQCGRKFGNKESPEEMLETEESSFPLLCSHGRHSWKAEQCMICVFCGECTGYGANCISSGRLGRKPGHPCTCGSGDSGCSTCGSCRVCAGEHSESGPRRQLDLNVNDYSLPPSNECKDKVRKSFQKIRNNAGSSRRHRNRRYDKTSKREGGPSIPYPMNDSSFSFPSNEFHSYKYTALSPAELNFPVQITAISTGHHHTICLDSKGNVYTFGNNYHGQLGLSDLLPRVEPSKVNLPSKVVSVAAGSYHCVVLLSSGDVYTFGLHTSGQLGRENQNESSDELWFATPGPVSNLGPKYGIIPCSIHASSESTFIFGNESLIKSHNMRGASFGGNSKFIYIYPPNSNALLIDRQNGRIKSFNGVEQVDLHDSILSLDPFYNVLWSLSSNGSLSSYHPLFSLSSLSNHHILVSPENALPFSPFSSVSSHKIARYFLLALNALRDVSLSSVNEETRRETNRKDNFLVVNRFESHGGGWGYSSHSVEAIRFKVDSDVLIGGFGLFGGRGEYVGKIKLFECGTESERENEGDLLGETENVTYECSPNNKFDFLFPEPIVISKSKWYLAWASISGPSSDCGASGREKVLLENDSLCFSFKSSKKSNNGTAVDAGQIPTILYKRLFSDKRQEFSSNDIHHQISSFLSIDVTLESFESLLQLLSLTWIKSKESSSHVEITTYILLSVTLKLISSYIQNISSFSHISTEETNKCIQNLRGTLRRILTDSSNVSKSFDIIRIEAQVTFVSCFSVFFPTENLRWSFLCSTLVNWESGEKSCSENRYLSTVLEAHLCSSFSWKNILEFKNTESYHSSSSPSSLSEALSEDFKFQWNTKKDLFLPLPIVFDKLLDILCPIKTSVTSKSLLSKVCILISNIISELAQLPKFPSTHSSVTHPFLKYKCTLHSAPLPFKESETRSQRDKSETGEGFELVVFSVNRCGIYLYGISVLGRNSIFDYELELFEESKDVISKETPCDSVTDSWKSLQRTKGTTSFLTSQLQLTPISYCLRTTHKYALFYKIHGRSSMRNNEPLTSVIGSDGTTFTFHSIPLQMKRFKALNMRRGQISQILYINTITNFDEISENKELHRDSFETWTSQDTTDALSLTTTLISKIKGILDQSTPLKKNHHQILNDSPYIASLLPVILSYLDSLSSLDSLSYMKLLSLIQSLLSSLRPWTNVQTLVQKSPFSLFYSIVESSHPYPRATVTQYRVSFPPGVTWMSLEFDSECSTTQPEDYLQIYIKDPVNKSSRRLHSSNLSNETYRPLLSKFSGSNWPKNSLLLPGNDILFSLETASDYLKNEVRDTAFGFKVLLIGYEGQISQGEGLDNLEKELVYLGGNFAGRLLQKSFEGSSVFCESSSIYLPSREFYFESRNEVETSLEGPSSLSSQSHILERNFLEDFIKGEREGGKLLRALQSESVVDLSQTKVEFTCYDFLVSVPNTFRILTRDQYGSLVHAPGIQIEVLALRLEETSTTAQGASPFSSPLISFGGLPIPNYSYKYKVTHKDKMSYHSISFQKAFENYSFEELRYAFPRRKDSKSETIIVSLLQNGIYSALWTPSKVGVYQILVFIDEIECKDNYKIQIFESRKQSKTLDSSLSSDFKNDSSSHRQFTGVYSTGLRIRLNPSLQSEQIGVIPPYGIISILEEIINSDGTWVRLTPQSLQEYSCTPNTDGWTLVFHQHYQKKLLENYSVNEPFKQKLYRVIKCGASGHNIRSHPHYNASPIGMLHLGDEIYSKRHFNVGSELWIELVKESAEKHCFKSSSEYWTLVSSSSSTTNTLKYLSSCSEALKRESTLPKLSSRKPSFFSKWFIKADETKCHKGGSESSTFINKDLPPELQGVSVKELIKVLGESRANGNGDTPPGSPNALRRSRSPKPSSPSLPHSSSSMTQDSKVVKRRRFESKGLNSSFVKEALTPSWALSTRTVFAAFLWHWSLVHDAIEASSYLKFNPLFTISSQISPSKTYTSKTRYSAEMSKRDEFEGQCQKHDAQKLVLFQLSQLWNKISSSCLKALETPGPLFSPSSDRLSKVKPGSQICELCRSSFPIPVTYHMRLAHSGCGAFAGGHGYNSGGHYCGGWAGNCGDGGIGGSSWYLLCNKCRDNYMTAFSKSKEGSVRKERENASFSCSATSPNKSPRLKTSNASLKSKHETSKMFKNNAEFLLSLRPKSHLIFFKSQRSRSVDSFILEESPSKIRFQNLISSSLSEIHSCSLLKFIFSMNDLSALRSSLQLYRKKSALRIHGIESFNMLFSYISRKDSLHDLFWSFVSAMETPLFSSQDQETIDNRSNNDQTNKDKNMLSLNQNISIHSSLSNKSSCSLGLLPHPMSDLQDCKSLSLSFHSLLRNIGALMSHLPKNSSVLQMALRIWSIDFKTSDHSLLLESNIIIFLSTILSSSRSRHDVIPKSFYCNEVSHDVTSKAEIVVSSRSSMSNSLRDSSTETFWESGDEDRLKSKFISIIMTKTIKRGVLSLHIDNSRDLSAKVTSVTFLVQSSSEQWNTLKRCEIESRFIGWESVFFVNSSSLKIELKGPDQTLRVRQIQLLEISKTNKSDKESSLDNNCIEEQNCEKEAFRVFRLLISQIFENHQKQQSLTPLQEQVFSSIETILENEQSVFRQSWESSSIVSSDKYTFELLQFIQTLRAHSAGYTYLIKQEKLLINILLFLHTGTLRIQQIVLDIFSGLIFTMSPNENVIRVLLGALAKGLSVTVKGRSIEGGKVFLIHSSVTSLWWLKGGGKEKPFSKKIGETVLSLLKAVLRDGEESWKAFVKASLAQHILAVNLISDKSVENLSCSPEFWFGIAALSVIELSMVEAINSSNCTLKSRFLCRNHDDDLTSANISCDVCGTLCSDCNSFLHLPRSKRSHIRRVIEGVEKFFKIDVIESCARLNLYELVILVDSSLFKTLLEFKSHGYHDDGVSCRFCGVVTSKYSLCSSCVPFRFNVCLKTFTCGHSCGGLLDEEVCLPCLKGCDGSLKQNGDDMCMICFTDSLYQFPSIQLSCGHVFHHHCCLAVLSKGWIGPVISFGFSKCPICKRNMSHISLKESLKAIEELYEDVRGKVILRLKAQGEELQIQHLTNEKGNEEEKEERILEIGLSRFAYYLCFKCKKSYYGGTLRCEGNAGLFGLHDEDDYNSQDLICGACSDVSKAAICSKHGTDYLDYKCRYCCSVAVFFCFGTTHFCNGCHEDFQRLSNIDKKDLPPCPLGPKSQPTPGNCPLQVAHPATGEEFALGCGICRNTFTY